MQFAPATKLGAGVVIVNLKRVTELSAKQKRKYGLGARKENLKLGVSLGEASASGDAFGADRDGRADLDQKLKLRLDAAAGDNASLAVEIELRTKKAVLGAATLSLNHEAWQGFTDVELEAENGDVVGKLRLKLKFKPRNVDGTEEADTPTKEATIAEGAAEDESELEAQAEGAIEAKEEKEDAVEEQEEVSPSGADPVAPEEPEQGGGGCRGAVEVKGAVEAKGEAEELRRVRSLLRNRGDAEELGARLRELDESGRGRLSADALTSVLVTEAGGELDVEDAARLVAALPRELGAGDKDDVGYRALLALFDDAAAAAAAPAKAVEEAGAGAAGAEDGAEDGERGEPAPSEAVETGAAGDAPRERRRRGRRRWIR